MRLKDGKTKLPTEKTVQMRVRDSVYKRYRKRGRKNSNLWVVYSPKSRQDFILSSDLELIYWLHFIESDSMVQSFSVCDVGTPDEPDFLLNFADGQRRADYIGRYPDTINDSSLIYDNKLWVTKYIDAEELLTVSRQALRWLKPIAYAAAIRNQKLTPLHNALIIEESKHSGGTVKSLIDQLPLYDSNHVVGMLMRHFIEGRVNLNLADASFGGNTHWTIAGCRDEQRQ